MAHPPLNHRVEGSGPPLLLVHGFGISFDIWKELAPRLAKHLTLVMVELPGIGASPAPLPTVPYGRAAAEGMEDVRLQLGIEKWDVLGYSTGSRLAETYVQSYPEHVGSAIFLCPLVLDRPRIFGLRLGLRLDRCSPPVGTWILSGWRLKFLISLYGFNLRHPPAVDDWFETISRAPVDVLKETLRIAGSGGASPFRVPVPSSLIWALDDIVPARPAALGPGDHIVHAQHAAPVVAAEEVAETVLGILTNPPPEEHA